MSAANTDKVRQAAPNFATTLSGTMLNTDTSLTLASATGLPTATAITLVIDATDPTTGASTPSLKEVVTGTLSGTTVSNLLRGQDGTSAIGHASGANVVMWITANLWNDFQTAFLQDHTQLGHHTLLTDSNGNNWLGVTATASAVNYVNVTNSATGSAPYLSPGGTDSARSLNLRGKGLAKSVTIGKGDITIFPYDYVASGCVITADAAGSTLNWSMTSGVVVINGNPVTVAAVSAQAATASKDTYVDVLDNGDGTGVLVMTGGNIVANNAASPALASNSVRLGIIVAGASNIAAAASINQGQETALLPIASSTPYAVTDSLGNLICPRDPQRKLLGYRQITGDVTTTSATLAQITGLSCPVIVPANRKIKGYASLPTMFTSGGNSVSLGIYDGTVPSGAQLSGTTLGTTTATVNTNIATDFTTTPGSASKTYNVGFNINGGSTLHTNAATTNPAFIRVELV